MWAGVSDYFILQSYFCPWAKTQLLIIIHDATYQKNLQKDMGSWAHVISTPI